MSAVALHSVPMAAAQAAAGRAGTAAKEPTITVVTKPIPLTTGANEFTVTVADAAGKPISGAVVTATF